MRRVIVLGGLGLFGRAAAEQLKKLGVHVQSASRREGADLRMDANNSESIRSVVRAGNIVLDAAGPFHTRTPALLNAAIETGFDIVDLNDNLGYAESVVALQSQIEESGIRVLSSASTVSAFAAAVIKSVGISAPRRIASFLAPASRHTANVGAALSLLQTVGQPIRILRDSEIQMVRGWRETRTFPLTLPLGPIHGHVFESADTLYLPRIYPSLREVAMYVDANTFGANAVLTMAAHSNAVRAIMRSGIRLGASIARRFGSTIGGVAYEIENENGNVARFALAAKLNSYLIAVAPAVLAVQKMANDQFEERGLVLPDEYADLPEMLRFLTFAGVNLIA